uniref:Uncharacterized protein n=1 Tax=Arion vulgaris TaxID=1028688 RepID=A0A0B7AFM9_9EUPU
MGYTDSQLQELVIDNIRGFMIENLSSIMPMEIICYMSNKIMDELTTAADVLVHTK